TPQQNGIAERKNRTLIEAARTMLADSQLPIPFWAEAVNTACYNKEGDATFDSKEHDAENPDSNDVSAASPIVPTAGKNYSNITNPISAVGLIVPAILHKLKVKQSILLVVLELNPRVLVTKPQKKTPYELLYGHTPSIGFMRPFGCPVTILNTLDPLGKFEGKVDEGFLVGYSMNSKSFRVFNSRTCIVQETLHVNFLENKPNVAGFQDEFDVGKIGEEANQQYMLFLVWSTSSINPQNKERDVTFDGKEHDAEKPEFAVNLSPSSSALSGEQDAMTKKNDKGKSHILVDLPHRKRAIGTKWVYRNKKDERGIVVRNKARLVAQGHTQEERIDYEEVFAPVARIEAIRLFLAYASFMGFMVYQMDVKSAFLYETIKEEVYVCQPSGFEDPYYPDKLYKMVKVLFGLHQAPRAWYETLAYYLLKNRFHRGQIDQTLFIKK
nr:retrovirus-related Pol polyprotein from transposon TNT 1-94 [Tanacetum cinerariifolium]